MKYIAKFEGIFNTEGNHNLLDNIYKKLLEEKNLIMTKESNKYIINDIKLDEYDGKYKLTISTLDIKIEYYKKNKLVFISVYDNPVVIIRKIYYTLEHKYNKK